MVEFCSLILSILLYIDVKIDLVEQQSVLRFSKRELLNTFHNGDKAPYRDGEMDHIAQLMIAFVSNLEKLVAHAWPYSRVAVRARGKVDKWISFDLVQRSNRAKIDQS